MLDVSTKDMLVAHRDARWPQKQTLGCQKELCHIKEQSTYIATETYNTHCHLKEPTTHIAT